MHVKTELLEKIDEVLSEKRLPAVVVDLVAFQKNIQAVAAFAKAGGKTLRVATKSIRVPELLKKILAYGPPFQGLLCYSAAEISNLAEMGFNDLMLAYPTLQKADLQDIRKTHDKGVTVSCVFDSSEGLAALAAAMQDASKPLPVLVDIDVSLIVAGFFCGCAPKPYSNTRAVGKTFNRSKKISPAESHWHASL